jgi:hypothetical protein
VGALEADGVVAPKAVGLAVDPKADVPADPRAEAEDPNAEPCLVVDEPNGLDELLDPDAKGEALDVEPNAEAEAVAGVKAAKAEGVDWIEDWSLATALSPLDGSLDGLPASPTLCGLTMPEYAPPSGLITL